MSSRYFLPHMQLSAHGLPVVLTNTPFDSWTAATWTPSLLAERVKFILCKKSQENVFKYFAVDKPLSTVKAFTFHKPFLEVVYPGKKFVQLVQETLSGTYYYSSGGIELLNLEDIYTNDSLSLLTFPAHGTYGQVNFWFGGTNVTAFTHYDTSHNLHALVYGRKKFIVFPPTAYAELGLYPSLHQFYRQAQLDVLSPEVKLMSKAVEITLRPGEVLYIPPYWFHRVISLETTISVNVWSNSETYLQMEEIYSAPIPFEEEWGTVKLLKAFNYFVDFIVHRSVSREGFVRERVFERYRTLLAGIPKDQQLKMSKSVNQYCLSLSVEELLHSSSVEHIQQQALRTAEMFMRISPEAVRELNLGNYIEQTAWRLLGTEHIVLLPFYLKECFS